MLRYICTWLVGGEIVAKTAPPPLASRVNGGPHRTNSISFFLCVPSNRVAKTAPSPPNGQRAKAASLRGSMLQEWSWSVLGHHLGCSVQVNTHDDGRPSQEGPGRGQAQVAVGRSQGKEDARADSGVLVGRKQADGPLTREDGEKWKGFGPGEYSENLTRIVL